MPHVSSATFIAKRAAQLLPAPPASGDPALYVAWDELVWSTAHALARLHPADLKDLPREDAPLLPCAAVTWQTLLALAASTLSTTHPSASTGRADQASCRMERTRGRALIRRNLPCR